MTHDIDIPAGDLRKLYETMLRIRLFEDRVAELYAEQEMKCPVHLCIGQEAIAAGVCIHLSSEDTIFSTHRSHGHCIAKGMDLRSIAAELYGKETGCCRGRGGSMHLAAPEIGIPGTSAIVGGCIPLAVGAALSSVFQEKGSVAVAFFGDGAVDEGTFHESLNFASLKELPVIFVCENNFYATNSPQWARQPNVGIAERGRAYGIPGECLDGNDVVAVYRSAGDAVGRARAGKGPTLLEYRTYRWKAHVGPDADIEKGARPKDEYEEWVRRCPVDSFQRQLLEQGKLTDDESAKLLSLVEADIGDAMDFAKKSPFPDPAGLSEYVC